MLLKPGHVNHPYAFMPKTCNRGFVLDSYQPINNVRIQRSNLAHNPSLT